MRRSWNVARETLRARRCVPIAAAKCGTATTDSGGECRASAGSRPGSFSGSSTFHSVGVGASGVGPYVVRNPQHFLFREPIDLKLREGDLLGDTPGRALPQPIGHEGDVRVSTLAKFQVEPPPAGMAQPTEDPSGITLLADGIADWSKLTIGEPWDYFQRPVPAAKAPPIPVAAEMIYWQRPAAAGSFTAVRSIRDRRFTPTRNGAAF